MYEIVEFLGWLTVVFYILSLITFILKRIKYKKKNYLKKIFIRNHWYLGLITILIGASHGIYMWFLVHPNIFGILAFNLIVVTGILGINIKKGKRVLIKYHRIISTLIIIFLISHILTN